MVGRIRHIVSGIAGLLVFPMLASSAWAGNNSGGTARLSWDEAGLVLNLASAPADSFPLFLSLSGAPDVHALAVVVQGFPSDPTGACYGILPSLSDSGCSSTSEVPPVADFHGESTSTWLSISHPASGGPLHCASWLVTASGCSGLTPAVFTALVRAEDSNGNLDTLAVLVPATIGSSQAALLMASTVAPAVVLPETPTMLRIHGNGFLPGARVTLSNGTSRTEASRVIVLSPDEIAATLAPAPSADPYNLTVSTPDGRSAVSGQDIATTSAALAATSSQLPRPTNAAGAIRALALWADQSATVNVAHVGLPLPTSLTTDSLLIPRPAQGDTMAVLKSTPSDCIEFNAGVACCPTYVEYNISPPRYATSIGLLQMGKGVLAGVGAFNDDNLPIVAVRTSFADGDSTVDTLRVGRRVRNKTNGFLACPLGPTPPFFVLAPDDSLNVQVYASGGAYYDAQELRLPASKRSKRISAIRISELPIVHNGCGSSGFTGCQSYLSGIGLWPSFEIRNRHGGGLGLQTQYDPGYANLAYGGYIVRDTLFGAHRTFKSRGCMLSCMAMVNSYLGDSVTVLQLNKYLALNNGYAATTLVTLDQVNGQNPGANVVWTVKAGVTLAVNDTVLIESAGSVQRASPLVTILVGPTVTQGTILRRHSSGVLVRGMQGLAYDQVLSGPASTGYSSQVGGHQWNLVQVGGSASLTPPLVEKSLADSLPVLLTESGHYVLARGWRPSFGPNFASGTYLLNDPGHTGVFRLNQSFLANGIAKSYENAFLSARSCVPLETNHFAATALGSGGVTFILQGGGRLGLTDPAGHVLDFYPTLHGYDGNIAGASAWGDYGAGLDDDPGNIDAPVELVDLPGGTGGDYRVVVLAGADATYGLGASTYDAGGVGPRAYAEYPLQSGQTATFNVHVVQGATATVRIDTLATTSVADAPVTYRTGLLVRPNPSRGKVEFVAQLAVPGQLKLEVYDVAGRLVAEPFNGPVTAGLHVVQWDAQGGGSMNARTGLYFVRMKAGTRVFTRRLMVTQ